MKFKLTFLIIGLLFIGLVIAENISTTFSPEDKTLDSQLDLKYKNILNEYKITAVWDENITINNSQIIGTLYLYHDGELMNKRGINKVVIIEDFELARLKDDSIDNVILETQMKIKADEILLDLARLLLREKPTEEIVDVGIKTINLK